MRYRPRSSSRSVTVAARFAVRGRCARRPSSSDRRRLSIVRRSNGVLNLRGRGTFRSGDNRICVWAREGRGSYRKPRTVMRTFKSSLVAATAAESSDAMGALNTIAISSTRPITGTSSNQNSRCEVETKPIRASKGTGAFYTAGATTFSATTCNAVSYQATISGVGTVALAVGPTALNAPARVVRHQGDCHVEPADNLVIFGPAMPAFVGQLGCRVGKIIPSKSEARRRVGLPANGAVLGAQVRGRPVFLAPAGTTVDILVDSIP